MGRRSAQSACPDLEGRTTPLTELGPNLEKARAALKSAQLRQARAYNAKRKEVTLNIGDQVLLHRAAIAQVPHLASSYRAPFVGPYDITHVDAGRDNYTLDLPPSFRIHPTFLVSALRRYTAPEEDRTVSRPGPVDENNEYEVEAVIGERKHLGQRQYLVRWLGYDASEATWEREANLVNAKDAIAQYHRRKPLTSSQSGR